MKQTGVDLLMPPAAGERRSPQQLREHYEIERELADRLRRSSRAERTALYSIVYNELFRRVPLHPQLTRVTSPETVAAIVAEKMRVLRGFLRPEAVFLEIGAGDCRLSMEAARHVKFAYALDVSDEVNKDIAPPANFRLVLSDGIEIPLPDASVDVAYSYQLMEHVHPDDVCDQLRSLYRVMAPGGVYVCITPNRLCGPHDISRYFEHEAHGFHLKEYTIGEVAARLRTSGFETVNVYPGFRGIHREVSRLPFVALETVLDTLPASLRQRTAKLPGISAALLSAIVARKRSS